MATACRSAPMADGGTLEVTAVERGVGETLSAIAVLREDIARATLFKQALERPDSPALDWVAAGARGLIAFGLQRRNERLQGSAQGESQLVKASLTADLDPAMRVFLAETVR